MPKPDYTALTFPGPPPGRPYVIADMIASADGKAVVEGDERGLGSRTDRRLLHELRMHADVVLAGAGTLRATGHTPRLHEPDLEALRAERGKPRPPIGAILTASGDLPLDSRFFTSGDFDACVYLADGAPPARREALAATGRPVIDVPAADAVPAMLRHMRAELGARLVMLEGGPTLNGACFRVGAVDELFLTLGPVIVAGHRVPTAVETPGLAPSREGATRLELLSAVPNAETGELYLRYRVRR